jgi:integrase
MKPIQKAVKGRVGIENKDNRLRLNLPRAWFDGEQKRFALGLSDSPENRLKAEQIALQLELDYLNHSLDLTLEKYKPQPKSNLILLEKEKNPSLLELWDRYQKYKKPTRKVSTQISVDSFKPILLKIKTVDCLDAISIQEELLGVTTNHLCKRILIELNAAIKWAIKHRIIKNIQTSPFEGMAYELPAYNFQLNPKPNAFSQDEMDLIIQSFKESKSYSYYSPLVQFLFLTGCRTSEAIGLRGSNISSDCSEIEFNGSLIYRKNKWIQTKGSKTNRRRSFPCSSRLTELLLEIKPSSNKLVFPGPRKGGPINRDNFSQRAWNKIVDPIKPNTTPYCCRDSFITLQLLRGTPAFIIAKWVDSSVQLIEKFYADSLKFRDVRPID